MICKIVRAQKLQYVMKLKKKMVLQSVRNKKWLILT